MGEGVFRRGGTPQISGNPAPCPSLSPRKGGAVSPWSPLGDTPPPKSHVYPALPPKPSTKRGSQAMVGVQGAEMDFLGNKRTLGLRPPTLKLKRFREHPGPPQRRRGREAGGILGPSKALWIYRLQPHCARPAPCPSPRSSWAHRRGQHLGASPALGWDQVDAPIDPSLPSASPVWIPFFSPAPIAQGVPRGARGVQSKPTPASPSAKL